MFAPLVVRQFPGKGQLFGDGSRMGGGGDVYHVKVPAWTVSQDLLMRSRGGGGGGGKCQRLK